MTVLANRIARPTAGVILHGGSGWKDSQVNDPVVFVDPNDATKLVMMYMGEASAVHTGHVAIGRATANVSGFSAGSTWTEDAGNPVITAASNTIRPCAHDIVGTTVYLYCLDYASPNKIVRYTSTNSGVTWGSRIDCITLTGQGRDDGGSIDNCGILREGGTLHMVYTVLPGTPLDGFDAVIRYASSSDNGDNWAKSAGDLFGCGPDGSSDHFGIEWHQLLKVGDYYMIVYEAATSVSPYQSPGNNTTYTCNLAFSKSMTSGWAKAGNNPIWPNSDIAGRFDRYHTATPAFYQINSVWYLFHCGGLDAPQNNFDIAVATVDGELALNGCASFDGSGDGYLSQSALTVTKTMPFWVGAWINSLGTVDDVALQCIWSSERTDTTEGNLGNISTLFPMARTTVANSVLVFGSPNHIHPAPYWVHVLWMFSGAALRSMAVNGAVEVTETFNEGSPNLSSGTPLTRIGLRASGALPFLGSIADVTFGSGNISSPDLALLSTLGADYSTVTGIAHWYPLISDGKDVIGSAHFTETGMVWGDDYPVPIATWHLPLARWAA